MKRELPTGLKQRIAAMDAVSPEIALQKTTHLGIGAHQDDLEISLIPGILDCYQDPQKHFCGVVVTNGSGAPRSQEDQGLSEEEFIQVRNQENLAAARLGKYSALALLGHSSQDLISSPTGRIIPELEDILFFSQPEILFTHSPFDHHPTHVAVCLAAIRACRNLAPSTRPQACFGLEGWGGLGWLPPDTRLAFSCAKEFELQNQLLECFRSQNRVRDYTGGTMARRKANALLEGYTSPQHFEGLAFGLDLTPLIADEELVPGSYLETLWGRSAGPVIQFIEEIWASSEASGS